MPMLSPDALIDLLRTGSGWFDGEVVDQCTHALQTAQRARDAGADDELVTAAALHDCGRLRTVATLYPELAHQEAASRFCAQIFGPRVAWLISAHVAAKRYLVATDLDYAGQLSPVSVRSLEVQGGPMRGDELATFARHPWALDAAALRRWDDLAKVPGAPTPTLDELVAIFARAAALRETPPTT
jgi:predicted HD phosphohydrolase